MKYLLCEKKLYNLGYGLVITISIFTSSCGKKSASADFDETSSLSIDKIENVEKKEKVQVGHGREDQVLRDILPPLPEPMAYFGDLGRPRLVEGVDYSPTQNGSVILVIVDAVNAKRLSVYGSERDTSPNLKSLADEGLLLTNYISNSSWTRPSFTTMITGLTKKQHKVELNGNKVTDDITTLAERFSNAGYRTAAFVGNPLCRKIWGFGQGFQTYLDTEHYKKAFPLDGLLVDDAIKHLKKIGDQPFFMMLFLTAPHTPYRPPSEYRKYLREVKDGPVIEYPFQEYVTPLKQDEHDRILAAYDGELAYVDMQIGRLTAYIKESLLIDRTSIIVTADHGEMMGEHNCYVHSWHMWEPTLRVPFIMTSPKLQKLRGMSDDRPFTHTDIVPTVLHLAGLDYSNPKHMGVSIVDKLKDPKKGRSRQIYSQYNTYGIRRQAIRKDSYKMVHHHLVPKSALARLHSLHSEIPSADPKKLPTLALDKERYELYNLASDPSETTNLFEKMTDTPELNELLGSLSSIVASSNVVPPNLSEETIEALTNAGYLVPMPSNSDVSK